MRLFVAVELPSEIKENVISAQKELKELDIKLVEPENLHFCIKFLGEVPEDKIEDVKSALDSISFKKFEISLKGVGAFPDQEYIRVLWVGVDGEQPMIELAGIIDDCMNKIGFEKEKRAFVPHLTIGRVKSGKDKEKMVKFISKYNNKLFGSFSVNRLKLISSELTPEGPVYEEIHEVELL